MQGPVERMFAAANEGRPSRSVLASPFGIDMWVPTGATRVNRPTTKPEMSSFRSIRRDQDVNRRPNQGRLVCHLTNRGAYGSVHGNNDRATGVPLLRHDDEAVDSQGPPAARSANQYISTARSPGPPHLVGRSPIGCTHSSLAPSLPQKARAKQARFRSFSFPYSEKGPPRLQSEICFRKYLVSEVMLARKCTVGSCSVTCRKFVPVGPNERKGAHRTKNGRARFVLGHVVQALWCGVTNHHQVMVFVRVLFSSSTIRLAWAGVLFLEFTILAAAATS